MTKLTDGTCYTFAMAFIKASDYAGVISTGQRVRNFTGMTKPTKGAAVLRIVYHDLKISLAGAHLDAGSTAERTTHVNGITNGMYHDQTAPDLSFFLGDLNYRLRRPSDVLTRGELVEMILSPDGRKQLYQLDSFKAADFPGWVFPDPRYLYPYGPLIYPTYKRNYSKRGGENPCVLMLRAINAGGTCNGRSAGEWCALCYKLSSKQHRKKKWLGLKKSKTVEQQMAKSVKVKKKWKPGKKFFGKVPSRYVSVPENRTFKHGPRGLYEDELQADDMELSYELGWLDRIGYKINPTNNIGVRVEVREYEDLPRITLSDHAPVFMVLDASW
jgi:hypothetical protein